MALRKQERRFSADYESAEMFDILMKTFPNTLYHSDGT
jgi:hypothetical protein